MSAPRHRRTTSRGSAYVHPKTGETAWSVTTILQGVPKTAIPYWAARVAAEYAVANRTAIDAILSGVRLVPETVIEIGPRGGKTEHTIYPHRVSDPDAVAAAVNLIKDAPWRERERAAKIGSAVHAEIEAYILGKPRPQPELPLVPYMDGFHRFLDVYHPEFLMSEGTVWNRTEAYAGTLDWIATIGQRRLNVIGDTKSGSGVYPEAALQMALYRRGEFVLLDDGSEEPLPRIDGAVVLHLNPELPEGYSLVPVQTDEAVFRSALYAREVFRWMKEGQQRVLGVPAAGPDTLDWTFERAMPVLDEEAA